MFDFIKKYFDMINAAYKKATGDGLNSTLFRALMSLNINKICCISRIFKHLPIIYRD